MSTPRVAAIVLSWNGREDTLACLASLGAVTYPALDVIVVDNGSTDGVAEAVADAHPGVDVVRLEENTGFSGGVNTGIRVARERGAEAVLPLNNDMEVEPGFVEPLAEALAADPLAAAACSQILYADRPDRVWYAGAPYRPGRGHFGRNTHHGEPPLPATVAPYATACACWGSLLVPVGALDEVGVLDDELFAYREDLDWSLRAAARGRHVLVVPASVVRHRVSGSTGGEASPATIYFDTRNLIAVTERHDPLGDVRTGLRRGEIVAAHVAQALSSRQRGAGLRAVWNGWRDARRGRFGPPDRDVAGGGFDPGLELMLRLRPPTDRRGDSRGRCVVCGAYARFVRNRWVIPAELARSWPEGVDRESGLCSACGASRRVRAIGTALVTLYGTGAATIPELVQEDAFAALEIAELNAIGRMHRFLAEHSALTYAEYPEEDLHALSYADASFDLVLTSDTLEHVADPERALREIRRVLRPGGRHVFTVPVDETLERSRSREGLPAMHHGRGGGPFALVTRRADMLVHTDFGRDLPDLIRAAGFDAETIGTGVEAVYSCTAR